MGLEGISSSTRNVTLLTMSVDLALAPNPPTRAAVEPATAPPSEGSAHLPPSVRVGDRALIFVYGDRHYLACTNKGGPKVRGGCERQLVRL